MVEMKGSITAVKGVQLLYKQTNYSPQGSGQPLPQVSIHHQSQKTTLQSHWTLQAQPASLNSFLPTDVYSQVTTTYSTFFIGLWHSTSLIKFRYTFNSRENDDKTEMLSKYQIILQSNETLKYIDWKTVLVLVLPVQKTGVGGEVALPVQKTWALSQDKLGSRCQSRKKLPAQIWTKVHSTTENVADTEESMKKGILKTLYIRTFQNYCRLP